MKTIELKSFRGKIILRRIVFIFVMFGVYFYLAYWLSLDDKQLMLYILYISCVMLISVGVFFQRISFLKQEFLEKGHIYFSRYEPFSFFGKIHNTGSYNFVFEKNEIYKELVNDIETKLMGLYFSSAKLIKVIDYNNDLSINDSREFFLFETKSFILQPTSLKVILKISKVGNVFTCRWWIIVCGGKESEIDKFIKFITLSPVSFLFYILSGKFIRYFLSKKFRKYSKIDNSVLLMSYSPYSSFYNDFDILNYSNSTFKIIVNSLIDVLRSNKIDVSDLLQVSSINIYGGNNQLGGTISNNGMISNNITSITKSFRK